MNISIQTFKICPDRFKYQKGQFEQYFKSIFRNRVNQLYLLEKLFKHIY